MKGNGGIFAVGWILVLWACLGFSISWAETVPKDFGTACIDCHEKSVERFNRSFHGRVFGSSKKSYQSYGCESCHGSVEKHLEDQSADSIVTFGKKAGTQIPVQNETCLKCHSATDEVALWKMGRHEEMDLSCAECHSGQMAPKASVNQPETCLKCHADIRSDIRKMSRHPIIESKVTCNDCHNSHGTMSESMLRSDVPNELCYKCHAEKRGPFIWEHTPVEENCNNCHNPHGSNNFKLLKTRVSNLCQDCHNDWSHASYPYDQNSAFGSAKADPGARLLIGRSCLNCHSYVHGSTNTGNAFLLESSGKYLNR